MRRRHCKSMLSVSVSVSLSLSCWNRSWCLRNSPALVVITSIIVIMLTTSTTMMMRMTTMTTIASSSGIIFARSMTSTATAVGSRTHSRRVAVVGGGLAGLSVAHHLIEKSSRQKDGDDDPIKELDITIFDRFAGPGLGGASAVAGGLLHPLSPRGKLVHLGLEGLASSSRLIDAASKFNSQTILRDKLYRIATDSKHVETLERTARELPDIAKWCEPSSLKSLVTIDSGADGGAPGYDEEEVLGALLLQSGCKVIHVPSYLQGLWSSCQSIIRGEAKWHHVQEIDDSDNSLEWAEQLEEFDCVIFAAGSGLFQSNPIIDENMLPIQLVRGQSIEMTTRTSTLNDALLSGKYISPLPGKNRVLVGATHEFKPDALKPDEVKQELKDRSYSFASFLWDGCGDDGRDVSGDRPPSTTVVDRITSGYRVQTNRGKHGRQPVIGRIDTPHHSNSWIFTGLSSRGLLYHGIYGDMLSEMILSSFDSLDGHTVPNDDDLIELYELDWWRRRPRKTS